MYTEKQTYIHGDKHPERMIYNDVDTKIKNAGCSRS